MRKLTEAEWRDDLYSTLRTLEHYWAPGTLPPDEMNRAAEWIVRNGITVRQWMGMLFYIAMPILTRLDNNQREILNGCGNGPAEMVGEADDLPF